MHSKTRNKLSPATAVRIIILITIGYFLFDYVQMKSIESILDENPSKFEITVEADLCNSFTNGTWFFSRYFLDKLLSQRKVKTQLISGNCSKGSKSTLLIEQEKNQ